MTPKSIKQYHIKTTEPYRSARHGRRTTQMSYIANSEIMKFEYIFCIIIKMVYSSSSSSSSLSVTSCPNALSLSLYFWISKSCSPKNYGNVRNKTRLEITKSLDVHTHAYEKVFLLFFQCGKPRLFSQVFILHFLLGIICCLLF
jgi:hypothetical protein